MNLLFCSKKKKKKYLEEVSKHWKDNAIEYSYHSGDAPTTDLQDSLDHPCRAEYPVPAAGPQKENKVSVPICSLLLELRG